MYPHTGTMLPRRTYCHISGLTPSLSHSELAHITQMDPAKSSPGSPASFPHFHTGDGKQKKPNQKLENVHILEEQQPLSRLPLSLPAPQEFTDHHHLFNAQIRGRQTLIAARCCTAVRRLSCSREAGGWECSGTHAVAQLPSHSRQAQQAKAVGLQSDTQSQPVAGGPCCRGSALRAKVRPCPKVSLQLAKEFSSTGAVSSKASQLTTDIPNWCGHSQPVPREEGQSLEGLLWGSERFQSFSPTKPSPATFPDHHTAWGCHFSPKGQKAAFPAEKFE